MIYRDQQFSYYHRNSKPYCAIHMYLIRQMFYLFEISLVIHIYAMYLIEIIKQTTVRNRTEMIELYVKKYRILVNTLWLRASLGMVEPVSLKKPHSIIVGIYLL